MEFPELCPACGKMSDIEAVLRLERTTIRGEEYEVQVEGKRCPLCGETFSTAKEMERILESGYSQYRQRHGIIAPAAIRALRERYGASQKAFGIILGFGELTINSYEQGALPSDANASLLRLVEKVEDFRKLFEARKELIGPTQRKRIEIAIAKLDEAARAPVFAREASPPYSVPRHREVSIYTGFLEPDRDRLFALMRAIIEEAGRSLYKTQLLKLCFYCDFAHFRKSTVSISGWTYAAITYGPVPDDFQSILADATSKGILDYEFDRSQDGELFAIPLAYPGQHTLPNLSEEELQTVREAVAKLGKRSSTALVDLSHREKAWTETENAKPISYEWAEALVAL